MLKLVGVCVGARMEEVDNKGGSGVEGGGRKRGEGVGVGGAPSGPVVLG